jgi:hypothetical protein
VDFRRSVQSGNGSDDLLEALRERLSPDAIERRARRQLVQKRRPIREGQLGQLRALDDLGPDTELERRPTVLADLVEQDGSVSLVFEGRELTFPAHARDEVVAIADSEGPFSLSDLPGSLDDDGRLVLARRLVREGFLLISEA